MEGEGREGGREGGREKTSVGEKRSKKWLGVGVAKQRDSATKE
jgi:hypothetical protein